MVHCTERRLSLHFLLSSSTRVCPDRSPPGAVSSEKRLSLPWCCWGGEGGRLIGNSRGGPGSSLSLFTPRPAILTYPLPSPLPPVWVPPVLSFSRPVENPQELPMSLRVTTGLLTLRTPQPPSCTIPAFTTFCAGPSLLLSNRPCLLVLPQTF